MNGFRKFRKIFLTLLWISASILFIVIITGVVLAGKYEEKLKELSIAKINQNVDTKISVEEMHARFLRTFPYISIVMKNVIVHSSNNFNRQEFTGLNTENLLTAENLYLQFNITDLLLSKMRVRKIYAVNGSINLLVDSEGQTNYMVIRKEEKGKKEDSGKQRVFELDVLKLSGFGIEFNNFSKKTYSSTTLDDLMLKGRFSGSNFTIGTSAGLVLHNFTRNGFRYANDYKITLQTLFEMDDDLASIRKGEIILNTIRLDTKGTIRLGEDPFLDLAMEARNFNFSTLLSSFPQKLRAKIPFQAQGRGDVAIKVKGPITSTKVPSIESVYVLNLAQLSFQKETLRNIKLKGSYTNGDMQRPATTEIDIQKFRITDRNSIAEGKLMIRNLVNPAIHLKIKGMLDASQLLAMIPGNKDIEVNGSLLPDLSFSVKLNSFRDINTSILARADLSGQMKLSGLEIRLKEFPGFSNINGIISFADNSWYPELTLMMGRSDFEIKARTGHVPEILLDEKQALQIQAIVKSNFLDLEPFLKKEPDQAIEADRKAGFFLPSLFAGRLNYSIAEINTGYFKMQNVSGTMDLAPAHISCPEISFNAMQGQVNGSVSLDQNISGDIYLKSNSELGSIDIKQLFEGFGNFGQESLRADQVRGKASGTIAFNAVFDSTLRIRSEKIITEAALVIRNGELLNFEPLRKLSAFIEVEELEHIRFSTLENNIFIHNNHMTIPEMDIKSSAFNITASGSHTFNENFDYKLKILLSELLTGKTKPKNREFYMMEENRRASLYLSISGTAEDYKIKYDKKEAIAAIKNDLQQEKTTLKTILHEEFGFFRKDSLHRIPIPEKPEFIMNWEDDNPETGGALIPGDPREEKRKKRKEKILNQEKEEEFELDWDDGEG